MGDQAPMLVHGLMAHFDSEAIAEIDYDPGSRVLFVRFVSGGWYAYLDTPAAVFQAFVAAPSKGRFFQDEVRDRYAFRRLEI